MSEKTLFKNVRNVNSGVDSSRIQQNKPALFVSWDEDDGRHYEFFTIASACENFKKTLTKYEIEDEFKRMGNSLSEVMPFSQGQKWQALSQYGYILAEDFNTREEANQYTIKYYMTRMNLIRQ